MAKKPKEIKARLKLTIPAGQANPAPPLGPILGQNGINMPDFCNQFNDKTKDKMGEVLPVDVEVFTDGSFKMKIKEPTVSGMIKKVMNLQKGSAHPKKEKVGSMTAQQVEEIAGRKMKDLNTTDIKAAMKIVAGTAKSMGVEVKE